jgi:hypothetical protein
MISSHFRQGLASRVLQQLSTPPPPDILRASKPYDLPYHSIIWVANFLQFDPDYRPILRSAVSYIPCFLSSYVSNTYKWCNLWKKLQFGGGGVVRAVHILYHDTRWSGQLHAPVTLLPIISALQPLWTLRRTEKYLGSAGNRTAILRLLNP